MTLEKETLITISQNERYLVLDKFTYLEKNYCYIVRVNNENFPTKNYMIVEEIIKDNEIFAQKVINQELYKELLNNFAINFVNENRLSGE